MVVRFYPVARKLDGQQVNSIIPNDPPKADLKSQLEVVSRVGAFLLIAFYSAGFLVVTFANASRGIVGFGLFRTRMLTAGILFSAFLALPLLNWSQAFGGLGLPKLELSQVVEAAVSHLRAKWFYSAVFDLFGFCLSAWGLAFFLCLFVFHCELGGRFTAVFFLLLALATSVLVAFNFQFRKHPRIGIGVCLIIIAVATVSVLILKERQFGLVVVWFLLVAYVAHYINKDFREAAHPRHMNWHWVLVNILVLFTFFSIWLYPRIAPTYGGGQPTRAVFQFANPSPIDGSSKDSLWILDEVDAGYYVLKDPTEHKAIFVPRSLVSAIYFDAEQH
jgi:hypothetical protein